MVTMRHAGCRAAGLRELQVGGLWRQGHLSVEPVTIHLGADGDWTPEFGALRLRRQAIDLRGTVALPALADHHAHVWSGSLLGLFLPYGITSVRDVGSPRSLWTDLAAPAAAHRPVPRVVLGGPMLDGPKPVWRESSMPCSSPVDVGDAVRDAGNHGARWLKIYRRFPRALLGEAVREAYANGLKVTIHSAPGGARSALRTGVHALEHVATLAWDLVDADGTQPLEGATLVHETHRLWATEVDRAPASWLPHVPVTSTFSVHKGLLDATEGRWSGAAEVPGSLLGFWKGLKALHGWTQAQRLQCSRALEAMLRWSETALRRGVRLAPGTDTPNPMVVPGRSLWWEIDWFARLGVGALDAYLMATAVNSTLDADAANRDLVFIDLDRVRMALSSGRWGDAPVTAVLRDGCLFRREG